MVVDKVSDLQAVLITRNWYREKKVKKYETGKRVKYKMIETKSQNNYTWWVGLLTHFTNTIITKILSKE